MTGTRHCGLRSAGGTGRDPDVDGPPAGSSPQRRVSVHTESGIRRPARGSPVLDAIEARAVSAVNGRQYDFYSNQAARGGTPRPRTPTRGAGERWMAVAVNRRRDDVDRRRCEACRGGLAPDQPEIIRGLEAERRSGDSSGRSAPASVTTRISPSGSRIRRARRVGRSVRRPRHNGAGRPRRAGLPWTFHVSAAPGHSSASTPPPEHVDRRVRAHGARVAAAAGAVFHPARDVARTAASRACKVGVRRRRLARVPQPAHLDGAHRGNLLATDRFAPDDLRRQ